MGYRLPKAELEEGAGVLAGPVTNPRALRLFALGAGVFVVMNAIHAAMKITSAIGAQTISLLRFCGQRKAAVVTLPHF